MPRELLLVIVAVMCLTVHSLDETIAFGAPSGPPWAAQIATIMLLIALTALHPRLGRGRLVPAGLLVLFGAFVVSTGWTAHLRPLLQHGPGTADATGVLFLAGGVLVLTSGALLLQRTAATRRRPAPALGIVHRQRGAPGATGTVYTR